MKRFLMTLCLTVLLVMTLAVSAMAAEHSHCVCGNQASGVGGHTCTESVDYIPIANEDEFYALFETATDGNIRLIGDTNVYLTDSFSLTKKYVTSGFTLNLCLNGNTLTMSGSGRITANRAKGGTANGTLNITACNGGEIEANAGIAYFISSYGGHINLFGGTVDGSKAASSASKKDGPVIRVERDGDTFTMYNGTVIGSLNALNGGAIYCKVAATIHIAGGTVRDGHASVKGGNIFVTTSASAVLKVSGGTISGGQATQNGGNIAMLNGKLEITGGTITGGSAGGDSYGLGGGAVSMEYSCTSFELSGNAKIYGNTAVVGDESAVGADIRLNGRDDATPNVITLGQWSGNGTHPQLTVYKLKGSTSGVYEGGYVVKFATDGNAPANPYAFKTQVVLATQGNEFQLAMLDTTGITMQDVNAHIHCVCGGQAVGMGHTCLDLLYTACTAASDLSAGGNVYLSDDLALSSETSVGGNTLNLCLNDKTITMSGTGRLTANSNGGDMTKKGTVNVTACAGGSVVAASQCRTGLLYTYKGTLNLYGGTVDASACRTEAGGAVTVGFAEDVFNMYGGTLVANISSNRGGAIYVNNTKNGYSGDYKDVTLDRFANIYGGQISGTTSAAAGKIYMLNGILTVNGTSVIGGEPVIQDTAEVVYNGVSLNGSYNTIYTMAAALSIAGEKDYIMLLDDLSGQYVSKSVYLDLNGKALEGLTVAENARISLFDSDAIGYVAGDGYVTLAEGQANPFVRDIRTDNVISRNLRFVTIKENDGKFTAHRIYLAVKSTVLYPKTASEKAALGYRIALRCDDVLATYLAAYGLMVTGDLEPLYVPTKSGAAGNGASNDNSKVIGVTYETNTDDGEKTLTGSAYITFNDGFGSDATITSGAVQTSLKTLVESAFAKYNSLNNTLQENLNWMKETYSTVMSGWATSVPTGSEEN